MDPNQRREPNIIDSDTSSSSEDSDPPVVEPIPQPVLRMATPAELLGLITALHNTTQGLVTAQQNWHNQQLLLANRLDETRQGIADALGQAQLTVQLPVQDGPQGPPPPTTSPPLQTRVETVKCDFG